MKNNVLFLLLLQVARSESCVDALMVHSADLDVDDCRMVERLVRSGGGWSCRRFQQDPAIIL